MKEEARILARCGKSFHLAARFLDPSARAAATRLYAFCRQLDDLADEAPDPGEAARELASVHAALLRGDSEHPLVALYHRALPHDANPAPALGLIETMIADTQPVALETLAHLLRYAHGAAGTVGLMMARALGASPGVACYHAVDLGIGMQLTNIARDVLEDAERGRRYIPAEWLAASPDAIRRNPRMAFPAVQRTLRVAESYYESGLAGLRYLPPRSARAIFVAASLYREIGYRIQRTGPAALEQRVYLSPPERVVRAALAWLRSFCPFPIMEHPAHLHAPLQGLCGAAEARV
jgi:phytoene synthase